MKLTKILFDRKIKKKTSIIVSTFFVHVYITPFLKADLT